ncbi:hypothetical protein [Paenibacillus xylanexedens]|uniref:hypothetical protein n=1 Tax=Paenibacillus xylanexedens TaxID=528191 RepID=UPI0011A60DB3|nr:hypothetical protein [Paenibacillus xylanexedens]
MATLSQNLAWCNWLQADESRIDNVLSNPTQRIPVELPPGSRPYQLMSTDPATIRDCYGQWTLGIARFPGQGNKAFALYPGRLSPDNKVIHGAVVFPEDPDTEVDVSWPVSNLKFVNPCI